MRMSTRMREIRAQIQTANEALRAAIDAQDVEAAETQRLNIENLDRLYVAAEAEFRASRNLETDPDDEGNGDGETAPKYTAQLFYNAVCRRDLSEAESAVIAESRREYSNRFSEGSASDGGLTVPDDLSTEIFEAVRSTESVRNLVHVENVTSAHGTRLFRDGEPIKLYNTAEYEELKEMSNRQYKAVKYNQKKFAGLMTVSNELLEDSFVNFTSEFTDWMADAARNTENAQIFYGAGGENHCEGLLSTAGAYKEVTCTTLNLDLLRKVYLTIKSGYRANAKWIMNSLAFAEVSNIKYTDGKSCIQPDPRTPDSYQLLGYPIEIYDTIETENNKTVIAFGDFDKGYRMFCRRQLGVSFTDIGAGAFESDSIKAKGTERFDGKIFDRSAIIIVRDVPVTPLTSTGGDTELTGEVTEATLKNLTKAQLLEFAAEQKITTVNDTQTKDNIVKGILAALNPTDNSEDETKGTGK